MRECDPCVWRSFEVKVSVHQEAVLLPLLFAIVVDVVTENTRRGVINEVLIINEVRCD